MELSEPKKKNKVRLQPQQPLPIIFDEDGNLIVFTAHLSALGTCIGEPDDMAAVQSMVKMILKLFLSLHTFILLINLKNMNLINIIYFFFCSFLSVA